MGRIQKKICIIGGDSREKKLAGLLARKGYAVNVLANNQFCNHENIDFYSEIKAAVSRADVIIAPVSSTDNQGYLKSRFIEKPVRLDDGFFQLFDSEALFLIGVVNDFLEKCLQKNSVNYVELTSLDGFAILNAIPTAEGALKIAIEETAVTIYNSNILILGLGRVGKTLGWRLNLLGAEVYAATRNNKAIARGKDLGLHMIGYNNLSLLLPRMDIIFNTVPALILNQELIEHINSEAIIIDLASSPGGTDFEAAKQRKIRAVLAPGLPGKIAPETAGDILGEIVSQIIEKPTNYI